MQDEKTLDFLQKIKDLGYWNKDYDYSKVKYVNAHTKINVICKEHGLFQPNPQTFKRGSRCPKCVIEESKGKSKYNQLDIIKKFKLIHGDKYDYSKVKYTTTSEKIKIICKRHGVFSQTVKSHLRGAGCSKCAKNERYNTYTFLNSLKSRKTYNNDYNYSYVEYKTANAKVRVYDKLNKTFHLILPSSLQAKIDALNIKNAENQTDYVVSKFKQIYADKYDYSKVEFVNSKSKLKIICSEHGEFEKTYQKHLYQGCPVCSKMEISNSYRKPIEQVLKEFKEVHGDKYDYSKVDYKGTHSKVIITCPEHGEFNQSPDVHIKGGGCRKCSGNFKLDTKTIIKQFKEVHGDKYDYSKVDYSGAHSKVTIICPEHGEFSQSPVSHKKGNSCPRCVGGLKLDNKSVIEDFKEVHGDKYDYSKVDYKSTHSKVIIICPEHGEFEQAPSGHKTGQGCPWCSGNATLDINQVVKDFKEVHGDKYDYSKVDYKSTHSKVIIICPEHGEFEQTPSHHKTGQGCPTCGTGWSSKNIIKYINDIRNQDVLEMDPVELNMLISQGKLPREFEELVFTLDGTGENSLKSLKEKLGIEDTKNMEDDEIEDLGLELEKLTVDSQNEITDAIQAVNSIQLEELEEKTKKESKKGLPSITNGDILVLDKELINTCDDEAVEFFIQYKLRKVWNEVLNDKRDANEIKALKGGKNSTRLKDLFTNEFNDIKSYKPPSGYSFMVDNKIAQPNMMQKLTVNRLKEYGRYGNWSGTGAGKTISFIIASREINSRLTLVICLNSTVNQLEEDILEVYPDSKVHTHFKKGQVFDRNDFNYLLLNYEKFQQGYSEEIFQGLNKNNQVDFIVIDEVHNAKQRGKRKV